MRFESHLCNLIHLVSHLCDHLRRKIGWRASLSHKAEFLLLRILSVDA